MRKFSINCDFGGQLAPFDIFIGQPEQGHHPLHFQADWLQKQRGGTIIPEVMDAISKLQKLAQENGVPLEDLCVYALGSAQDEASVAATPISNEESTPSSAEEMPQAAIASETQGLSFEETSQNSPEVTTESEAQKPAESLGSSQENIQPQRFSKRDK